MKKIILAAITGGIILWVWGFLAWVVFPLHKPSIRNISNEDAVIEVLRTNMDAKGVYIFPGMPADYNQASMEAYTQKYMRGPMGMIIYDPQGSDPMMASQFINGLIIFIISAFLAAWFLSRSTAAASSYFARVLFCGMLGIVVSVFTYLSAWNWMGYPLDYTTAMMIDAIVGWLLAGFGIAAIVKVAKTETA
ncbi:MAG: hypothetical protein HY707_09760 [Ignavibacteriae bacterium]|nr:hypothetical protein [Ignavibacteriota bacterium]